MFVAPWIVQSCSLKRAIVIAALMNALGSVLRYIASDVGIYGILLFGQLLNAISNCLFLGMPAELAAVWFPPEERAIATGILVIANQMGSAVAFILSPIIVKSVDDVGQYMLEYLIFCCAVFVMIAVFFPLKPNNPPSASVGVRLLKESVSILEIVRNFRTLITSNFHFFLLVIEYGILISGFNLWATFLQVVLEPSHPDDLQIGWCGFISTVASLLGSAFFPYIASKYANYRWTNISLALLACLFSAVFMVLSINPSVSWIWIHISASLLNIVFGGMLAFGIEFAAELAYPTEENLSANTVVASSQLFATVFIETLSLSQASALQILIFIICTSALSLSISAFIPNKILRYQFDKENPEISDSDVSHGGDSLSALIKN